MSNRPWMPFYFGDYLADTGHLSTIEHGAYVLLIAHYWMKGGLPDDDLQLARIARLTQAQWKKAKPVLEMFFSDGWKHKRVEFELTEAARISEAGRKGGKASAESRSAAKSLNNKSARSTTVERPFNDSTNDQGNDSPTIGQALQPQPQLQEKKEKKETGKKLLPDDWVAKTDHYELAREKGLSPSEVSDAVAEMRGWSIGNGERRSNWDYVFNNWLRRKAERGIKNGYGGSRSLQNSGYGDADKSVVAASDRLIERLRAFDEPAPGELRSGEGQASLRLISKG